MPRNLLFGLDVGTGPPVTGTLVVLGSGGFWVCFVDGCVACLVVGDLVVVVVVAKDKWICFYTSW